MTKKTENPVAKAIKKVWEWWKKLPWYGKIPAVIVLLLVVVLAVLWLFSLFAPSGTGKKVDAAHDAVVDTAMDGYAEQNKILDKKIKEKKAEIAKKLNQAGNIDAKTLEGRKKIDEAETMDDLDRLQKELGL